MAVVVIGDGPSAEGRGWGPLIDAQDSVVRLWSHEWQDAADYGTRYDHGLITSRGDPEKAFRRPRVSWFFYKSSRETRPRFINKKLVIQLPHPVWLHRANKMGAKSKVKNLKLTRGFVAAAGAMAALKPERLILVGFDMLEAGCTVSPRYGPAAAAWRRAKWPLISLEEGPPGMTREGVHDYAVEAELFRNLAAERRVEITWGF